MTLIQDVMRGLGDSHRLQLRSGFHWLCPKLGEDCTFWSSFGTNWGGGGGGVREGSEYQRSIPEPL